MYELKEIRDRALVNVKEIAEQNKDIIMDAYRLMKELSLTAYNEGLICLEETAEYIPNDMPLCDEVIKMASLLADGTEPQYFAEFLTIRFLANDYRGLDALLYYLYGRSMLMIATADYSLQIDELFGAVLPKWALSFDGTYHGENNDVGKKKAGDNKAAQKIKDLKSVMTEEENQWLDDISKNLQSLSESEWKIIIGESGFRDLDKILPYLNEEVHRLAKKYINELRYCRIMNSPLVLKEGELHQIADDLWERVARMRDTTVEKRLLDDILNLSDEKIQPLIKDIDLSILAVALKGEKEEIAECFYRNLSIRTKYELQENMEYMGPVRRCDVEDAQRKILQKIDTLK